MSYNKTAKKMMLCSMLFFILSCVHEKDMIESRPGKKTLDSAIKAVIEMEFKGLEVNRADKVFEKYKRVKIEIIEKTVNGQSFSSLIPEINQITRELNKLTVQEDLLKIMEEDGIQNYYIREFNNRFMEALVEFSEVGDYIDISLLKTIYAY